MPALTLSDMPPPRRHRMRRPARLDSARAWLASGAQVTLRGYARRYGVDRHTAYAELTMLGVALPASDEPWAVRPAPTPKRPRREAGAEQEPDMAGELPDGWTAWGGELMYVVGYTCGGAPFGMCLDEFPAHDLPRELRDLRKLRADARPGGELPHGSEAPF
jgi:hypothetical protein